MPLRGWVCLWGGCGFAFGEGGYAFGEGVDMPLGRVWICLRGGWMCLWLG